MRKYPFHLISTDNLGYKDSSLAQVGDVLPSASGYGQADIGLYFNVKTLNIVVKGQITDFVEAGLNLSIGYIFNSKNAAWQLSFRRFTKLPISSDDHAVLLESEGSEIIYSWDSANNCFVPPRIGSGRPILQFDQKNQYWVLYYTANSITEVCDTQGLLLERSNKVDQKISYV